MAQICSTLFDYPSIRQCAQLQNFIRQCVHTAWSLVSQVKIILEDQKIFDADKNIKYRKKYLAQKKIFSADNNI